MAPTSTTWMVLLDFVCCNPLRNPRPLPTFRMEASWSYCIFSLNEHINMSICLYNLAWNIVDRNNWKIMILSIKCLSITFIFKFCKLFEKKCWTNLFSLFFFLYLAGWHWNVQLQIRCFRQICEIILNISLQIRFQQVVMLFILFTTFWLLYWILQIRPSEKREHFFERYLIEQNMHMLLKIVIVIFVKLKCKLLIFIKENANFFKVMKFSKIYKSFISIVLYFCRAVIVIQKLLSMLIQKISFWICFAF